MAGSEIMSAASLGADYGARLLDAMFGGIDATTSVLDPSSPAANMMIPILGQICQVALWFVSVIVIGQAVRGAVGTAHDGKAMGDNKTFHNAWTPIRLSYTWALLAPIATKGGLCGFQVLIISCLYAGNHFANDTWKLALDYLKQTGGQVTTSEQHDYLAASQEIAAVLFRSSVVEAGLEIESGKGSSTPWTATATSTGYAVTLTPKYADGVFGRISAKNYGYIDVPCGEGWQDDAGVAASCNARAQAVIDMASVMHRQAYALVGAATPEAEQYGFGQPSISVYAAAVSTYNRDLAAASALLKTARAAAQAAALEEFADSAESVGWVSAGSYYWTLSGFARRAGEGFDPAVGYNPSLDVGQTLPWAMQSLAAHVRSAVENYIVDGTEASGRSVRLYLAQVTHAALAGSDDAGATPTAADYVEGENQGIMSATARLFSSLSIDALPALHSLAEGGDPVEALAELGAQVRKGALALGVTYLGASLATGLFDGVPFLGAASAATKQMSGPVLAILIALLVPVYLAMFWLPFLPTFLFLLGIVSVVVTSIEAVVAAPLWLAAHAFGGGDSVTGQHGSRGYLLLLGVVARPTLLLVGLLFSITIVKLIGGIIGFLFYIHASAVGTDTIDGKLVQIVLLIITMTVLTHKIFSLMHHLPEHILTWVGGHGSNLGEHGDEQRARTIVGGVMTRTGASMHPGSAAASGAMGAMGGAMAKGYRDRMYSGAELTGFVGEGEPGGRQGPGPEGGPGAADSPGQELNQQGEVQRPTPRTPQKREGPSSGTMGKDE